MKQQRSARTNCVRRGAMTILTLPFAAFVPVDAGAAEIKLPQAKPAVAFDVPDDWTIDKSGKGLLDMRSPEKNAIVVAEIIPRDKAILEAWSHKASAKLKEFGIAFDEKAKAPPTVQDESAFTKSPDKFTFSGVPSLATPGTPGSNDPVKPGKSSIETLTAPGTDVKAQPAQPMPKLPFHAVQYYGTTLNGKPVDVQLVIYTLPEKRAFVMMQESGSDDGRTVALAASVRGVKSTVPKAPRKPAKSSTADQKELPPETQPAQQP